MSKSIEDRLLEERKKLEPNRRIFCKQNNISYSNTESWETGRRKVPSEYLAIMDAVGADIYYIITGKRITSNQGYTNDHQALVTAQDKIIAGLERENELLREKVAILESAGASSTVYEQSNKRDGSAG